MPERAATLEVIGLITFAPLLYSMIFAVIQCRSLNSASSMKDQETQQRFVELRVQGWTFERIARELNVSQRTLINWSRKFRFDIQNQSVVAREALLEKLVASRELRAQALAAQLKQVEAELQTRNVADLSTARLFILAESLRRQIQDTLGELRFTSPLKEIPDDEYHEQAQDWIP